MTTFTRSFGCGRLIDSSLQPFDARPGREASRVSSLVTLDTIEAQPSQTRSRGVSCT